MWAGVGFFLENANFDEIIVISVKKRIRLEGTLGQIEFKTGHEEKNDFGLISSSLGPDNPNCPESSMVPLVFLFISVLAVKNMSKRSEIAEPIKCT